MILLAVGLGGVMRAMGERKNFRVGGVGGIGGVKKRERKNDGARSGIYAHRREESQHRMLIWSFIAFENDEVAVRGEAFASGESSAWRLLRRRPDASSKRNGVKISAERREQCLKAIPFSPTIRCGAASPGGGCRCRHHAAPRPARASSP